jgi:hypothetical protein
MAQSQQQGPDAQEKLSTEVTSLLWNMCAAWNRGDLDEFMQGYQQSPVVTFVCSSGQVLWGYDAIAENYRRNYPGPAKMGHLSFCDPYVRDLGKGRALCFGQFTVEMPEGNFSRGSFTVILECTVSDGWKIIHDHSSSSS